MTKPQPHRPPHPASFKQSTPHAFNMFCMDIRYGRMKKAKAFLKDFPGTDLEQRSSDGYTPLMLAARHGQHRIFKHLLDAGGDLKAQTKEGQNMLHLAAIGGNQHLAEALIKGGFDVNGRDKFGRTPLLEAAGSKNVTLVKVLLDAGADPNISDDSRLSPLMRAGIILHFTTVEVLLKNGAELDHIDTKGKTAYDVVRQQRNGKGKRLTNKKSTLRTIEEAQRWQKKLWVHRQQVNSRVVDDFNEASATWLQMTARRDFDRILKRKIQAGKRPTFEDLTHRNKDGMSAVDVLKYTQNGLKSLWNADLWRGQEDGLDRILDEQLPGWQRKQYEMEIKRLRAQLILETTKINRNRPKLL